MSRYRVAHGVATIGSGQPVSLSPEQMADRQHTFIGQPKPDGRRFIVVSSVPLQFKEGEEIGLSDIPKNLVDNIVPIEAPKTESDKIAAGRDRDRKIAAAKAKHTPPARGK